MPCGSCTSSKSIKVERPLPPPVREKQTIQLPAAKPIDTRAAQAPVRQQPKPVQVKATKNLAAMAKSRASDMALCPTCNAPLRPIISGSGARVRKKCSRCNREFV